MDIQTLFQLIENDLFTGVFGFIRNITRWVGLFAGVIVTIFIAIKVIKIYVGASERFEGVTLVRPALTLGAIVLYRPLYELLIETPVGLIDDIIIGGIGPLTGASNNMFLLDLATDKLQYTQDADTSAGGNGIYDILQVNPFLELFHLVLFFLASVVSLYILFTQIIMKAIYLVIGPFALAFSLVPGNEKVLENWFQGILSVFLWLPVLNLVLGIIIMMPINDPAAPIFLKPADILVTMVFQIGMVFFILKVPQFANFLVAQGTQMGQQMGSNIGMNMKGAAFSKLTGTSATNQPPPGSGK